MEDLVKTIIKRAEAMLEARDRVIVAIDGRCASGKTTLAEEIKEKTGYAVFHMDDFFLRPEQRNAERLAKPGENVEHERFFEEILKPLTEGAKTVAYRPFDCSVGELAEERKVDVGRIVIVEGSYSCHPLLFEHYDLHVFVTVLPENQMKRIRERESKAKAEMFKNKWIPLEEAYFNAFHIQDKCDLLLDTSYLEVHPVNEEYKLIRDPKHFYDLLCDTWCAETCAPRMRGKWSPENKTLGQCSVTAFLAQDIFGGDVYGVPLPDGNYHCFNKVGDVMFDLTSEQFGDEKLVYNTRYEQFRDIHFAKEEKYKRYLELKEKLRKRLNYRLSQ